MKDSGKERKRQRREEKGVEAQGGHGKMGGERGGEVDLPRKGVG